MDIWTSDKEELDWKGMEGEVGEPQENLKSYNK